MRFIAVLVLAAGCQGASPTYYADLKPILDNRCNSCHDAGGVGPFPLESYDDVSTVAELVVNAVESRQMPPWKAVPGALAYQGDPTLTDEQIALFRAWLDGGMREGDPEDEGQALPPIAVELPRVDVALELPEPYAPPPAVADDYRCFITEWPGTGIQYVTGFEVKPDNKTVVHHVAAFLVRPDGIAGPGVIDTFRGFDDADPGPGYTCYGGPGGAEGTDVPIQQVAQWVPGNGAVLFPEGVGIAVSEGSLLVMQLHYNTAAWDGTPDRSSIELLVEPEVDRLGAFAPFLNPLWPIGGMNLPAGQTTTHTQAGDPRAFFELLNGDLDLEAGFDIHAAMLHMHQLGRTGVVRVDRMGGEQLELLRVDDWDFDWQLNYRFMDPVGFEPGDEMFLSCTYENDRGADVNWGEGSEEEMCVGNLFISQR
ncbi:MAG: monooxygenase [Alphaproteobacteria bacterium]|nr:monooxygenase [Alphaproteobacteria bacterium]